MTIRILRVGDTKEKQNKSINEYYYKFFTIFNFSKFSQRFLNTTFTFSLSTTT